MLLLHLFKRGAAAAVIAPARIAGTTACQTRREQYSGCDGSSSFRAAAARHLSGYSKYAGRTPGSRHAFSTAPSANAAHGPTNTAGREAEGEGAAVTPEEASRQAAAPAAMSWPAQMVENAPTGMIPYLKLARYQAPIGRCGVCWSVAAVCSTFPPHLSSKVDVSERRRQLLRRHPTSTCTCASAAYWRSTLRSTSLVVH